MEEIDRQRAEGEEGREGNPAFHCNLVVRVRRTLRVHSAPAIPRNHQQADDRAGPDADEQRAITAGQTQQPAEPEHEQTVAPAHRTFAGEAGDREQRQRHERAGKRVP